jgi:hypothetical protein
VLKTIQTNGTLLTDEWREFLKADVLKRHRGRSLAAVPPR